MVRYTLLLLFIVMLTSRALSYDFDLAPGLSVKNALLYVISGLVLFESAIARNRKIELLSVIAPFGLLFMYALLTWLLIVLVLDYPIYSPRETLIALKTKLADQILILLVFFYGVTTARDALWLVKALIWVIVIGNVLTIIDTWDVPDLGIIEVKEDGRAEGVLGGANDYGALLAFYLPATIALYWTETGMRRPVALLGAFATLVALLMSVSRGAWVGLVVGALLAAFYLRQYISLRTIAKAFVATIVGCIAAGITLVATNFGQLIMSRLLRGFVAGNETVSSGRYFFWRDAIGQMLEFPATFLTGFGWDAYYQRVGHTYAMHSDIFGYLYNLGLIGVVLLVLSRVGVITAAHKAMASASAEVAAYLVALIFGTSAFLVAMVFNDMQLPAVYTWAMTGIVLRLGVASATVHSPQIHPEPEDRRGTTTNGTHLPLATSRARGTIR